MDSQNTAGFGFDMNLNYNPIDFGAADFAKLPQGNTEAGFFFGDEGIDTTSADNSFSQSFDSMSTQLYPLPSTESSFSVPPNHAMGNTLGHDTAWNTQLDFGTTQAESFGSYQPFNNTMKRSLQVDTDDFPLSKRHESASYASAYASPFLPSASLTESSMTMDTQLTPSSSSPEIGLSDEAADVCATWFSKYAVLPNDRHIESLGQLTGESAPAIRNWFSQMLKQGIAGHDSAYKSQTSLGLQTQPFNNPTTQSQTATGLPPCDHTATNTPPLRGGKKGCTPTNNPELLCRDLNKIYQCTRKCGKRYGRKCDWKRNEEDGYPSKSWICSLCVSQGVEKVKPCFRRYHFSQHFKNIHAGLDSADYDQASLVQSETTFPRRCGFCPHRFESRHDRIDHIEAHFKKGKCMLDWNIDEDHNRESNDGGDDDDDKFDDSQGNNNAHQRPDTQSRSPNQNGSSGNGTGGGNGPSGGVGEFQLSGAQFSDAVQQSVPQQVLQKGNVDDDSEVTPDHGDQFSILQQPASYQTLTNGHYHSVVGPGKEGSVSGQSTSKEMAGEDVSVSRTVLTRPVVDTPHSRMFDVVPENSVKLLCSTTFSVSDDQEIDQTTDRGLPVPGDDRNGPSCDVQDKSSRKKLQGQSEKNSPNVLNTMNQPAPASTADAILDSPTWPAFILQYLRSRHIDGKNSSISLKNRQGGKLVNIVNTQDLSDYIADCVTPCTQGDRLSAKGQALLDLLVATSIPVSSQAVQWNESLLLDFLTRARQMTPSDPIAIVSRLQVNNGESCQFEPENATSDSPLPPKLNETMSRCHIRRPVSEDLPDGPPSLSSVSATWDEVADEAEDLYLKSQSFLSVKLLGTGGFSTVDEVVHRETKLRISRKTLKNREVSALEELKKEVGVLQKLRHPHIIRFLGAYSKDDKVSILLSPVAETTLAIWLEKCSADRPTGLGSTVAKMFGCLTSSVRYLHEQRPVVKHMDIKPQNILVMHGDHEIPHVVLSDFGISSSEELDPGLNTKPLTRQYCAPEIPSGIARGQAADIWSLGCVFLEMLSVASSDNSSRWSEFRKEFSSHEGKYYWQEVPRLQGWLSRLLDHATSRTEATALLTVKSMLNEEPAQRPSATLLTMVFTPAPCCLTWPNQDASFPGPVEEQQIVGKLHRKDGDECLAEISMCSQKHQHEHNESFTRAKAWLNECSQNHEACQRLPSEAKTLPTRLLDIRPDNRDGSTVCLINTSDIAFSPAQVDYVALSHIWNDSDLTLSADRLPSMRTQLPRGLLSQAVNDAITAADRIGSRYIWVDSLCVVQDSEEDKRRECAMMASIFRNATLTIVAGSTSTSSSTIQNDLNVNPALSETSSGFEASSLSIDWQSPGFSWDTRAWGLQERLLCSRLLHLTGEQLYWECNALKASETFPRGLPSLVWEKVHTKPNRHSRSPTPRPLAVGRVPDCQPTTKDTGSIATPITPQILSVKSRSQEMLVEAPDVNVASEDVIPCGSSCGASSERLSYRATVLDGDSLDAK